MMGSGVVDLPKEATTPLRLSPKVIEESPETDMGRYSSGLNSNGDAQVKMAAMLETMVESNKKTVELQEKLLAGSARREVSLARDDELRDEKVSTLQGFKFEQTLPTFKAAFPTFFARERTPLARPLRCRRRDKSRW